MPHICTRCNNTFESGEDILKGCPVCGWKKFMFVRRRPAGETEDRLQSEQIITKAMGVRNPPKGPQKEETEPERASPSLQLPVSQPLPKICPETAPPGEEMAVEGKKLESIKITAPGTYELNLPSLFERDELIMAVKEGTYFIDLSSVFRKGKKD
jgi:predicted  nucleic acid-binding Zn-ribbon protein